MRQRQVVEFLILAEPGVRRRMLEGGERFDAWMTDAFPEYQFSFAEPAEDQPEFDGIVVVPLVGTVGGAPSKVPLPEPPPPAVADAILARLEAFDRGPAALN